LQQRSNPQSDVSYRSQYDQQLSSPGPTQQYYDNPAPQFSDPTNHSYRTNNYQPFNAMPEAIMKDPIKPVRPPTPPKIGWTCPTCTVINEPFRPGCEVCGENRPEDYSPPAGYKATENELRWLQDELQEKLRLEEVC